MSVALHGDMTSEQKTAETIETIKENEGRTLVLFPSFEDMKEFKEQAAAWELPYPIYYEGDEEISSLVEKFQRDEESVLCSVHLWEGLDIPGDSLRNVTIWALPYPPHDPVFTAKRNGAKKIRLRKLICRTCF